MAGKHPKVITVPQPIDVSKALDCSGANAQTVLGYYREGMVISLPVDRYLMFMHWITNGLFKKAETIEQVVSDKHTVIKSGDTVCFRCDFNEKEK